MSTYPISVIMPCYNKEYEILRILQAYDKQDCQIEFEVIAIDDGSTDNTLQILLNYHPTHFHLKIHKLEKNSGPATARNLGIEVAKSPLLLFVGDDILPEHDFIRQHIDLHEKLEERSTAILGFTTWPKDIPINSVMLHIDGIGAQQFSYYYMSDGKEYDFRHFYTSNVSIKTVFLRSVSQWFDTTFNYAAYEDVELAYRLHKRGLSIKYSTKPKAYHYHYHNVWTFSRRQYKAGLMANRLINKHPSLGSLILGKHWQLKIMKAILIAKFYKTREYLDDIEKKALRLGSSFENKVSQVSDKYYLSIFTFFFNKGFIQGYLSNQDLVKKVQIWYAKNMLLPLFQDDR
jgi:glycosyltransferase involved in cell wall biosynthesis